jgi:sporulation protein YlmC with PRC-barrel domain
MRLDLHMPIRCVDGRFGELANVVIDPGTRCLTHLVVGPEDRHDHPRLVPVEHVHAGEGSDVISLQCTIAEVTALESIDEFAYVRSGEFPVGDSLWDVGIQEMHPLPGPGSLGPAEALGAGMEIDYDEHVAVTFHRVPKGSVEIRRGSPVTSSEGDHVGHVVGFVVEKEEQIGRLVLEHGHLWRKREVAIPGGAIERLENDAVTLNLSSGAVGALEPLPPHRRGS